MSGEAGAVLESRLYSIFLGSGRIVSVAIPPWADGNYVRDQFASASEPYQRWLARARPPLDDWFAQQVAEGIPIVPSDTRWVEETDARADVQPVMVRLSAGEQMPNHESLRLSFVTARRVERSRLTIIGARVAEILRATETEQEPGSPPAPSLWARLFRRGRR